MTIVAAWVDADGTIHMAADCNAVSGEAITRSKTPKLLRLSSDDGKTFLVGYCGSYTVYNALRHIELDMPQKRHKKAVVVTRGGAAIDDAEQYMNDVFTPAFLKACIRTRAVPDDKEKVPILAEGSTLLVGYEGTLFHVQEDFTVLRVQEQFAAISYESELMVGLHVARACGKSGVDALRCVFEACHSIIPVLGGDIVTESLSLNE
jgi:hypothetical protein